MLQPEALPALATRGRLDLSRVAWAGLVMVGLWALVALLAPVLAPHDPYATDVGAILLPPLSPGHPLGTDEVGRDVLSRLLYAARTDLSIGLIGVLAPFAIGVALGVVSGYIGGVVDTFIMRLVDVALAFPFIVLVLAIVAVLGPGLVNYYIALAIVAWVPYARLVRAETLVLRRSEFVEAARLLGFSHAHIMRRHVFPNAVTPAAVFVITDIMLTILLGSGLSFFGLGAQPPTAEWGRMIAEGEDLLAIAWWVSLFPGVALILLTMGFSLLGDGLAEKLQVRA